jgi:hypothetical protein
MNDMTALDFALALFRAVFFPCYLGLWLSLEERPRPPFWAWYWYAEGRGPALGETQCRRRASDVEPPPPPR